MKNILLKTGIAFALIFALIVMFVPTGEIEEQNSDKETTRNFSWSCLSDWDGSHEDLKRAYKNTLIDPESFKHIETVFLLETDTSAIVTMECSAKNAFGGTIHKIVQVRVDRRNCEIIEAVSINDKFSELFE